MDEVDNGKHIAEHQARMQTCPIALHECIKQGYQLLSFETPINKPFLIHPCPFPHTSSRIALHPSTTAVPRQAVKRASSAPKQMDMAIICIAHHCQSSPLPRCTSLLGKAGTVRKLAQLAALVHCRCKVSTHHPPSSQDVIHRTAIVKHTHVPHGHTLNAHGATP